MKLRSLRKVSSSLQRKRWQIHNFGVNIQTMTIDLDIAAAIKSKDASKYEELLERSKVELAPLLACGQKNYAILVEGLLSELFSIVKASAPSGPEVRYKY